MEFERLLRRYFDGSLSEPEVRRLQELLDRVPDYAHEFRQLLEVRSLLHDDALRLSPPPALVEPLHAVLERRFAALAPEVDRAALPLGFSAQAAPVQPVQERRRRGFVRGAVGTFTAFLLAIGIALTPEIRLQQSADSRPVAETRTVEAAGNLASISTPPRAGEPVRASRVSMRHTVAPVVDNGGVHTSPVTDSGDRPIAAATQPSNTVESPALTTFSTPLHFPSLRDAGRGGLDPDANLVASIDGGNKGIGHGWSENSSSPSEDERQRTFNFGVVVASGQVAESPKPTAFMQNAYYLAFGLTSNDRLGVEAGFSNFRFDTRTAAPSTTSAKPATGDVFARRTAGGAASGSDGSGNNDVGTGGGSGSGTHTVDLVTQRVEQKVNYGAVFYDRRVRLGKTWDLCGRVTVGGADQSLMGNVRAYVAYTPTKGGSFTITAGVGASGLYNMIARDRTVSGNVGLTYGIETGF